MTGGNVVRGWWGAGARIGGQFNGWLNTMPGTAGLCWVYCIRTASVRRRVDEQSGSAQGGAGNSAKAIWEPGLFRWSGSAVRCPGGQAVFDGAAFTAKGEG